MVSQKPMWIWYYGDFELFQHVKLSLQREERGKIVPVFWKIHDCNKLVRFTKEVYLEKEETIHVSMDGLGYITIDNVRQNELIVNIEKGTHKIEIIVGNQFGIPSVFVKGSTIKSDESWIADCYDNIKKSVGYWNLYNENILPTNFELPSTPIYPISETSIENGKIIDFGKETYIKLVMENAKLGNNFKIYYGESIEEALDSVNCVIQDEILVSEKRCILPARACRYVRIVGAEIGTVYGLYEYLPLDIKGEFKTSNNLINKIYDISRYTFELTSRIFFLDGIKRDRWVWSGDAFQSYYFDYYSCFDEKIIERTIIALIGKNPIASHINGIMDYSLYWIISIGIYYKYTKNEEFIRNNYDLIVTIMEYCINSTNKLGLMEGNEDIWTFIDWADMEKDGALCCMQMLYSKALEAAAKCSEIMGDKDNAIKYKSLQESVNHKIIQYYWNEEKGAFVTTCHNGKLSHEVRRHANIFAIIWGFADCDMKSKIIKNVLLNDDVPEIKTPYFKFYEIEALCQIGEYEKVTNIIESYWGGMIKEGATAFWEEYNPDLKGAEHLMMYGEPFDKSLCHAWGASPLYIFGRYYLGVCPLKDGYEEFEVRPHLGGLESICGTVPIKNGLVTVKMDKNNIEVQTNAEGGILIFEDKKLVLSSNKINVLEL